MNLWKNLITISELNQLAVNSIHTSLGIKFIALGDDYIEAEMPVDQRTHRPGGYLHGGASVVLAESVASVASMMASDKEFECFGVSLHANHLKSVKDGKIIARATPIKIASRLHVWDIKVRNEKEQAICAVQLTVAIVPKNI